MKFNLSKKKIPVEIYWIIIAISAILGTLIRLKGLGKWPLALDEYYIIKSAENILKYGLPQLPNGGYYDRGIFIQYFIAFLLHIGIKAEFAGRILSVIFNLFTIYPVFKISKKIGGNLVATISVVIFSFSIWEIEFARFARMYAPFQMLFMFYIYLALEDYIRKDFSNYKWMIIISGLSIFVYEGSIFLAIFNFVPFITLKKYKIKYLISSIIMFIASFILNTINFRKINAGEIFPKEYYDFIKNSATILPIKIPEILLPFSFNSLTTLFLLLILTVIIIYLFNWLINSVSNKSVITFAGFTFLICCLFINQFGLFFFSFLIFVFWDIIEIKFLNKQSILLLLLLFLLTITFWYIFGVSTNNWYVLFDNFSSYSLGGISKRLMVGFFNYPNTYYAFLNYFNTLPILTIFSSLALIYLIGLFFINKLNDEKINYIIGSIIFLSVFASIPKLLYQETRYTFFLVPLVIILVVFSVYKISQQLFSNRNFSVLFSSITIVLVFYFSNDFNLYHLVNIDNEHVNYRMIYDNKIKNHLYRRWDIKTPIDFVIENFKEDDKIMINENSQEYYLPKVDYFNFSYRHSAFPAITANFGLNEKWSGAKLIYRNEDLVNLIENRQSTIWYLVFPEFWLREIEFYDKYQKYFVSEGIDGLVKVYKFPKLNI